MANKGYRVESAQVINQLRNDLRDRYRAGFPIVKEILQNAEDATDSTEVIFGTCQGFPNESHPLLQLPAIFFANNGRFEPCDAEAIHTRSLGYKSGSEGYIGRYGLGLSSVFHLCDAFIYLSLPDDPLEWSGEDSPSDIINPWSGSGCHEEWDKVTAEDLRLLKSFVHGRLGPKSGTWFCIWCPLRSEKVAGNNYLVEEFPGDDYPSVDFLLDQELPFRIANILPLLSKLETVHFIPSEEFTVPKFTVSLGSDTCQRLDGNTGSVTARVSVKYGVSKPKVVTAIGRQSLEEAGRLTQLKKNTFWPKRSAFSRETHIAKDELEKASPHGALVLSRRAASGTQGWLRREWCVYFPLGNEFEEYCAGFEGDACVTVALHGHFFIDAGRTSVEWGDAQGEPANEFELRRNWNACLRQSLLMPLLIPSLEDFVRGCDSSPDETDGLVRGLASLFKEDMEHICANEQFLRVWASNSWNWQKVPACSEYRLVPSTPKSSANRHCIIFPALHAWPQEQQVHLVPSDAPALTTREPERWPSTEVCVLLESVSVDECFSKPEHLKYLTRFLCEGFCAEVPADALRHLLNNALSSISLPILRQSRSAIQDIAGLLPKRNLFTLPHIEESFKTELEELLPRLADSARETVPLPHDLTEPSDEYLSVTESERFLNVLERYAANATANGSRLAERVALHLISRTAPLEDHSSLHRYKVFRGRTRVAGSEDIFSWATLQDKFREGVLFREPSQPSACEHLLRRICPRQELIIVRKEVADQIEPNQSVPQMEWHGALDFIASRRPALSGISERVGFMRAVLPHAEFPKHTPALRYLLHGQAKVSDTISLFAPTDQTAWYRFFSVVLDSRHELWRMLDRSLADELNPVQSRQLTVHTCCAHVADDLLDEALDSLEGLDWSGLTADERCAVIAELPDEQHLKRLAIHETQDGRLVCIDSRAYVVTTQISVPKEIRRTISILKEMDGQAGQRIRRVAKALDTAALAELALTQDHPERFADTILKCARSARKDSLRSVCWVPTTDRRCAAPRDFVFPEFTSSDSDFRRCFPEAFAVFPQAETEIVGHDNWSVCVETKEEQALTLGRHLAAYESFWVGPVQTDEMGLEDFLDAFRNAPIELMPAAHLVLCISASSNDATTRARKNLISQLCRLPSADRLTKILNYLGKRHEDASGQSKHFWRDMHDRYLEVCNSYPVLQEIIAGICLLNQLGRWCDSHRLAVGVEGIEKQFLLDPDQAKRLGLQMQLRTADEGDGSATGAGVITFDEDMVHEGVARLREYFEPWRSHLIDESQVGAFLAFLGDARDMRMLAESFLGPHTIGGIRAQLETHPLGTRIGVGANEELSQLLARQRFDVHIAYGQTLSVQSIVGGEFEAPVSAEFENLFLGDFRGIWGAQANRITFRSLDPSQHTEAELGLLLFNSLARLLTDLYSVSAINIQEFWESLSESDQLQLAVVQDMICDGIQTLVKQMHLARVDPSIREILIRLDRARREKTERQYRDLSYEEQEEDLARCRTDFKAVLEGNDMVQERCLNAIRQRLRDFQYNEASIPFELFQNADDALLELMNMQESECVAVSVDMRFVVRVTSDEITFVHFGRAINRYRLGSFDGSDRGYAQDLEKMLTLNASDKGLADDDLNTTGRFGLGFKSVFFACSKPCVTSGRKLAFEVVGGFWPRGLNDDRRKALQDDVEDLVGKGAKEATVVHLSPLIAESNDVLARFRRLAPVALAFARAVKMVQINEAGHELRLEWLSRSSPKMPHMEVAVLPFDGRTQQVLLIRLDQGQLLLAMNDGKVVSLRALPCVWVTAPTEESDDAGYAVNGPFSIDIGRSRLASLDVNQPLAEEMSDVLQERLCALYTAWQNNPPEVRGLLGASAECGLGTFWTSFWDTISAPFLSKQWRNVDGFRLLREVLWPEPDRGLGAFYRKCTAFPTGLPGSNAGLTTLGALKFEVKGVLKDVLELVSTWPTFSDEVPPGTAVSEEYRRLLVELGGVQLEPVTLAEAVLWELEKTNNDISPEQAERLSGCITEDLVNRLPDDEREPLQELLTESRFLAESGDYAPVKELLVPSDGDHSDDEGMRAGFAPPKYRLSKEYRAAVTFFRFCRIHMEAPSQRLALWAKDARTEEQKRAVLRYLVHGELSQQVAALLRDELPTTWLGELEDIKYRNYWTKDFSDQERSELLVRLGLLRDRLVPPVRTRGVEISATLENIYDWWHKEHVDRILEHRRASVPGFLSFDNMLNDNLTIEVKKNWATLLILGLCHTVGRVQPQQHRGFLEIAERRGWLDVFAAGREASAEEWIGILDEFIEQPIDSEAYQQWIRLFPAIYRMSVYLNDYIENLVAVDRVAGPVSVNALIRPRHDQNMPAGAPDIQRSIGIGVCFVLRELTMHGVLKNPAVYSHCFVPSGCVRDCLAQIGWTGGDAAPSAHTSKEIHDFLRHHMPEDHTHFDVSFDLPFRILATDNGLLEALIKETP